MGYAALVRGDLALSVMSAMAGAHLDFMKGRLAIVVARIDSRNVPRCNHMRRRRVSVLDVIDDLGSHSFLLSKI